MDPAQRAHSGVAGMPARTLSVMSGLSENTTAPTDQRGLSKATTFDTIPEPDAQGAAFSLRVLERPYGA